MENNEASTVRTITADDVRAGETGHHVRYVLAAGLLGVIAAFIAVGIYLNFENVSKYLSDALARDPVVVLREVAPYVVIFLSGALATLVLFTVWNLVIGPSESASQRIMRLRVILQFVIICAIVAVLYFLAN